MRWKDQEVLRTRVGPPTHRNQESHSVCIEMHVGCHIWRYVIRGHLETKQRT